MPALASSAARIPPAAPAPTMTTSVFSVAMALAPRLGLQAGHRQPGEGFPALHVGLGESRLRTGETNELPAGEVLVAAIDRVGEHAFDRVGAHRIEKRLRGRPGEARDLVLLHGSDHSILFGS